MATEDSPQHEYGASDITVLEGLEAVRKRPGMYIGSTGPRGLHHLVYEVVDNSVDEALAGYCDHIEVTLQADGGVRVSDNGRGIPVDMHPTEGKPTVEVVMTILHAGGKFGGGGYAVSGGLHGVGISVVNALSRQVDTEVRRQGHVWRMSFANGGRPEGEGVQGSRIGGQAQFDHCGQGPSTAAGVDRPSRPTGGHRGAATGRWGDLTGVPDRVIGHRPPEFL